MEWNKYVNSQQLQSCQLSEAPDTDNPQNHNECSTDKNE